jgi:ribosome-binding factor A
MKALTDAAPWLRRQLGSRLTVRHIPQLDIRHDDSIEAGDRVLRLLREIENEDHS